MKKLVKGQRSSSRRHTAWASSTCRPATRPTPLLIPLFLYNIGLAQRTSGGCRAAIRSFGDFIAAVEKREASDSYRVMAEPQVAYARQHLTELEQRCPPETVEAHHKLSLLRRPVLFATVSAGVLSMVAGGVLLRYAYDSEKRAQDAQVDGSLGEFEGHVRDAESRRAWGTVLASVGTAGVLATLTIHWLSPRWTTVLKVETNSQRVALGVSGRF